MTLSLSYHKGQVEMLQLEKGQKGITCVNVRMPENLVCQATTGTSLRLIIRNTETEEGRGRMYRRPT